MSIIIEAAKARCEKVRVQTTEEFSVYAKNDDMVFRSAEVWCNFYFAVDSGTYSLRVHTKVWADLGTYLSFAFEEGELGSGGYGTDWEPRHYDKIMQYPFFREEYHAFLKDVVSKIKAKIPEVFV